jgi:hypothetical protein
VKRRLIAHLVRALAATPFEPKLLRRLALQEAAAGRWNQALGFANQAINLGQSSDARLLWIFGRSLAHTQRCGEATFVVEGLARLVTPDGAAAIDEVRAETSHLCAGADAVARPDAPSAPGPSP